VAGSGSIDRCPSEVPGRTWQGSIDRRPLRGPGGGRGRVGVLSIGDPSGVQERTVQGPRVRSKAREWFGPGGFNRHASMRGGFVSLSRLMLEMVDFLIRVRSNWEEGFSGRK